MEATYKQEVKEKSRYLVWEHAVYSLTHNRINTRVLQPEYLRKLWNYSIDECVIKYGYSSNCDKSIFTDWQSYSDIIYGNKNANELRVAFFCGPDSLFRQKHYSDIFYIIKTSF